MKESNKTRESVWKRRREPLRLAGRGGEIDLASGDIGGLFWEAVFEVYVGFIWKGEANAATRFGCGDAGAGGGPDRSIAPPLAAGTGQLSAVTCAGFSFFSSLCLKLRCFGAVAGPPCWPGGVRGGG